MVEQKLIKACPNCKSKKVWKCGFAIRRNGKVQLYQCKKCGSKFRDEDNKITKRQQKRLGKKWREVINE